MAGDGGNGGAGKTTRRRSTPAKRTRRRSAPSAGSTPDSSGTTQTPEGPNPLGLEPDEFDAGGEREPVSPDEPRELDDPYDATPPEPIEWTSERTGAIVRAGGFLLHNADSLSSEAGGEQLWRATEADVDAIAPPLARILNRYTPARRLAGVSDEAELAFGLFGYAKRNLAERGRLAGDKRQREEEPEGAGTERPWPERLADDNDAP